MTFRNISLALTFVVAVASHGQQVEQHASLTTPLGFLSEALPDSPGAVWSTSATVDGAETFAIERNSPAWQPDTVTPQIAKKYARTIQAGMAAEPWGAKEKFIASLRKQVSVGGFVSPLFVAGVQHIRDSRPHYGTDSGAYGERTGAAYARQSAQSFLNIGLMSALLHDDPRYYVMGPAHPFKSRVVYAATRVFITRKDDGSHAPNIPLFVGVVSSQAMTEGFYPDQDRNWSRTVTGSLGSLAGKMATQQFKEFGADIRQRIPFLKKK